jgi:putative hydrolase of the HAD superfamily
MAMATPLLQAEGTMQMPWEDIDTVLLDMDGTLLDLHFDNHFWLSHVPQRFAEENGMPLDEARAALMDRYQAKAGTLDWYCVDYWSGELGLDIARLKQEIQHLIAVHPHVVPFLLAVRAARKRTVLVTNAHHKSVTLKMRRTGIQRYLDSVVSSHTLGVPKEGHGFWDRLQAVEPFDPKRTLLIDDSLPVLRTARDYGIRHLLGVRRPDSGARELSPCEFPQVASFAGLFQAAQ